MIKTAAVWVSDLDFSVDGGRSSAVRGSPAVCGLRSGCFR